MTLRHYMRHLNRKGKVAYGWEDRRRLNNARLLALSLVLASLVILMLR